MSNGILEKALVVILIIVLEKLSKSINMHNFPPKYSISLFSNRVLDDSSLMVPWTALKLEYNLKSLCLESQYFLL